MGKSLRNLPLRGLAGVSPASRLLGLAAVFLISATGVTHAEVLFAADPGAELAAATQPGGDPVRGRSVELSAGEIIVEIRAGETTRRTVLAHRIRDQVLLPASHLFSLIEMRIQMDAAGRLDAVKEPENVTLTVDPVESRIKTGGRWESVPSFQVLWTGQELYLATPVLARLLDVHFAVDLADMTVALDHVDHLPLGRRLVRERARELLLRGEVLPEPDEIFESEFAPIRGAALGWTVSVPFQGAREDTRYDLRLGANLMSGALEMRYADQVKSSATPQRTSGSWTRVWPRNGWLRQARLGMVSGTGPRPRAVRGVAVTNAPFLRSTTFGQATTRGRVSPGWEVELWREGRLVGFDRADEAGNFEIPTSIGYGPNVAEVRAYGPHGEMHQLTRSIRVDEDRLPAGAFEYSAAGGGCEGPECDGQGNLDLNYGLNDTWTVRAGADGFLRSEANDLIHPYLGLGGLIQKRWSLRAEAVYRALGSLELGYEPNPNLRTRVSRTVYDMDVPVPIMSSIDRRSRTHGELFFRPIPRRRSSFFTAAVTQEDQRHGTLLSGVLGVNDQRHGIRWTAEWRGEEDTRGVARKTRSIATLRASSRLPGFGLPAVSGIYLRGSAAYDISERRRDRIQLTAGRSLGKRGHVEMSVDWIPESGDRVFRFSLSSTGLGIQTTSQVSRMPDGRYTGAANLQGTLLWNDAIGRLESSPYRTIGQGGLSGVVFEDRDGDGSHDSNEPTLPHVTLRTGNRAVKTDKSGRYSIWGLVPFEDTELALDSGSLQDPRLFPQFTLASVAVPPNGFRRVNLAMMSGVEVSGRVYLRDSSETPVGGIPLAFRRSIDGVLFETQSYQDGEFYFLSLPPGDYEPVIPEAVLDRMGARLPDPSPRFSVRAGQQFMEIEIGLAVDRKVP